MRLRVAQSLIFRILILPLTKNISRKVKIEFRIPSATKNIFSCKDAAQEGPVMVCVSVRLLTNIAPDYCEKRKNFNMRAINVDEVY